MDAQVTVDAVKAVFIGFSVFLNYTANGGGESNLTPRVDDFDAIQMLLVLTNPIAWGWTEAA